MTVTTNRYAFTQWTNAVNAAKTRLANAEVYRDRQIATRDRKNAQISLTDRESRMWDMRIDNAQAIVDRLARELRVIQEGPART